MQIRDIAHFKSGLSESRAIINDLDEILRGFMFQIVLPFNYENRGINIT